MFLTNSDQFWTLNAGEMRETIALRETIANAEASGRSKQNAWASCRMRETSQPWSVNWQWWPKDSLCPEWDVNNWQGNASSGYTYRKCLDYSIQVVVGYQYQSKDLTIEHLITFDKPIPLLPWFSSCWQKWIYTRSSNGWIARIRFCWLMV